MRYAYEPMQERLGALTLTLIFAALMLLTSLWNLAIGIWVVRRTWQTGGHDAKTINATIRS